MMDFLKNLPPKVKKTATGLVTAAMVPTTVFLLQAADIGAPMTAEFEGAVLRNYLDIGGVESWCIGETQVGRLESGYTLDYCKKLFFERYPQYAARVYACYDEKSKAYVTPMMHAAFTDVFYNAGAGCKSGMIRNLKAGNPVAACDIILAYKNVNGKDCSVRANGCYGVWDRRVKLHTKCIQDAKLIPSGGIK